MKRFLDIAAYGIISAVILVIVAMIGVYIWQEPMVLEVLGIIALIAWAACRMAKKEW